MRALIVGGTRNLGHSVALELLGSGASVTVVNRGVTPDELPAAVERLRADRTDRGQLAGALGRRDFDVAIDTTLYNGTDARAVVEILRGRVSRYIFISTGQVYLVRDPPPRPAGEEDYEGAVIPSPGRGSTDYESWRYGVEKRDAEDALTAAHARDRFPFVSLRLPMVNGERDHYERIRNYLARLDDGGPILLPDEEGLPLRHVYAGDAVRAMVLASTHPTASGRAFNISQPETSTLGEFLEMLASMMRRTLRIRRVPRATLESRGLLPHCSPFSGRWMSELDNERSVSELGMRYTPLAEYVGRIVEDHRGRGSPVPRGYATRQAELELAEEIRA